MLAQWIDRADALAARHERLLSITAGLLFVMSCASYAGWIHLPEFLGLSDQAVLVGGTVFNVLWWATLRPRVHRRRAERENSIQS